MKNFRLLVFLVLTPLTFSQLNSPVYITGSINDVCMNPVFSPDGKTIAYTKSGYQGIWIYDLSTQSSKEITDEPAAGFAYKWSSDSKSILSRVAKYEDQKRFNAVKVFDIETNQALQLTEYRTRMPYLPDWSAGDTKVILPSKNGVEVYSSGKQESAVTINKSVDAFVKDDKIVARSVVTETENVLEPIKDAQVINLVTSPDKNKVAFEVMGGNMYSMNIDGTNLTDLGKGNRPLWSSDSKKIIYMITEDDGYTFTASDVYTINVDGTQKKNITNTPDKIEMNPCFSPDGKMVAFDVYNDGSIYLLNIE